MKNRTARILLILGAAIILAAGPARADRIAAHTPRGNPADWTYVEGTPEASPAWDPCSAVTWSAPDGPLGDAVARAIRNAARYSGLNFQRVAEGGQIQATFATPEDHADLLAVNAIAMTRMEYSADDQGQMWMLSATLYFEPYLYRPKHPETLMSLVMHEMGHAVGLGHASDSSQIMGGGNYKRYGAGDRNGLRDVQRTACEASRAPSMRSSAKVSVVK